MKKFLFLIVIFFVSFGINAQNLGVKGGLNLSTANVTNSSLTFKMKPGMNVSMFFQKDLVGEILSIRPEFGVYQKGYKYDLLGSNTINFNYMQFDLDARLKIPVIPVYFLFGPYGAYAISGESVYDSGLIDPITSVVDFGNDKTSPLDFGLSTGVGFVQKIALLSLFVECKYEIGIFDYNDYPNSNSEFKNRNLVFSAGLMIGL